MSKVINWQNTDFYETQFKDYYVSKSGLVLSTKYGKRILKPDINSSGYKRIKIYTDNTTIKKFVHQLVLETFCPRIEEEKNLVIDHINSNRLDNRLENLRYITQSENVGRVVGRKVRIGGIDFISIREASRTLHISESTIRYAIKKGTLCKGMRIEVIE